MTDYFSLLDQPRRPWLEVEDLKREFLQISARFHPDRVHTRGEQERASAQQRYTELNSAYACLRDPKDRLRHLLDLEGHPGARDVQQVPGDLMDLSLAVGQECREADIFLEEKATTRSPLLKVQLFRQSQEWIERLDTLQKTIQVRTDHALGELRALDAEWMRLVGQPVGRAAFLPKLVSIQRLLSYFSRWNEHLRERIVRLAF